MPQFMDVLPTFNASNSHLMPQFAMNTSALSHSNNNNNADQKLERLKSTVWCEMFADDPRFNGQLAVQNERWRYTQTALYELGYMIHGTLNSTGIDDPLKNKRMHHFDHIVMDDICRDYLDSFSSIPSTKDGKITYFGPFDFKAAKQMLGGVKVISRPATDGLGGYYHLDRISEIAYSENNRTMTMRYLVKWSELKGETEILNQYAAH
eukprot:93330_1